MEHSSSPSAGEGNEQRITLAVIGDPHCGKSSVVGRYIHGRPPAQGGTAPPTMMDQFVYAVNVGPDRTVQVRLWDTMMWQGLEVDCYLICFDVSDTTALSRLHDKWHGLMQVKAEGRPFVVIGCRSDLRDKGVECIETQVAAMVAEDMGAWGYIECSALTGDKVKDLFDNVVLCALEGKEERLSETTSTSSSPSACVPSLVKAPQDADEKGKQKLGSDDEREDKLESVEDRATRPGLSMGEDEKWENFRYWSVFALDNWYPVLQEYTFPTTLIPLSQEDAEAFVQYQEKVLKSLDQENLPPIKSPLLKRIEERLDEALEVYSNQAFVKLSDRCPKDGATGYGRIERYLDGAIEQVNEHNITSNEYGLCALYTALHRSMKVESGKEALRLLLISFRTLEDVKKRLEYRDRTWGLSVAVRQWFDFAPSMQFRGYVYQGQMNALSQYFYDCYFPVLQQYRDKIELSILAFWATFREKVPYKSYVIDFAILPCNLDQSDLYPVRIVELNPFDYYTDATLFNWLTDKHLIQNGPFQFRINETASTVSRNSWWIRMMSKQIAERNTNNRA